MSYDDQLEALERGGLRCVELIDILTKLGFVVRDCGSAGHKVFKHPSIREFFGSNFDCGHRETAQVKPVYVRKIRRIIEQYESDLRTHLGERK